MEELVFTPSSVLALLSEIEELEGAEISLQESENSIVVTINDNQYTIDTEEASTIQVDDYTVDTVAEANEEGYADLEENGDVKFEDTAVEGGIVKELAKTLLLGGLVRLTSKAIKNI